MNAASSTEPATVLEDSLPQRIHAHARSQPQALALVHDGSSQTWSEYSAKANRIANRLLELGIGRGGRVALLGKNSAHYAEMMAGILTAGAAFVPLPSMVTASTLFAIIEDCEPQLLFVDRHHSQLLAELLELAPDGFSNRVICLDFQHGDLPQAADWYATASDEYPAVAIEGADVFCVMYSSGTTGVPKGIILSHDTRVKQARTMVALEFNVDATNLIGTPLYSLGALSTWMPAIYGGACNVLFEKFDAGEYLELIQQHRVSHLLLVPVQFERLLARPDFTDYDLSSVKYKFGGSAPMSVAVKQDLAARFPGEMFEFYSMTEGGVTTALLVNHFPDKLASVGQATNGCSLKIIDDDGAELATGEIGEIVGRSELHMDGYVNNAVGDNNLYWLDSQGDAYIRTGDLGYLDADGFLFLRDRKKDMIISGGMNIYASDIEASIIKHEAVREVAVVGVSSERWGETPVAVVKLTEGASITPGELRDWANNTQLSKHQRIAGVSIVDSLPRNHLGKLLKLEIKQILIDSGVTYEG